MEHGTKLTTGLPGLDQVLKGVMPGDNIVWKVESIEDYEALVGPYSRAARASGRKLIYFRFASHRQLLPDDFGAEIHRPDPAQGFESFVADIHDVIGRAGRGALYVFDCLSDLAEAWISDQMLGNFFMLTCPYLYDLETVTYFAIYRNRHASFAIKPITETTQFLLDVFRHEEHLYIRPIKVQHRSTSSMNMIHVWGPHDEFKPITTSAVIADVLASSKWQGLCADRRVGFWRRIFMEVEDIMRLDRAGEASPESQRVLFLRLARMIISTDPDMLDLVSQYFSLADIVDIRSRMIGIGRIGGKATGMLLARAIVQKKIPRFREIMESHDSFYIGSDVFYTFLVQNKVWRLRQKQRDSETFLEGLEEARVRIMNGKFMDYTMDQFEEMLDYFGQSPFICRSSSLLEDAYGNAFAGKYDSIFCVNQGPREKRMEEFLDAIRTIYASSMSEKALRYRADRGLLDRDEQMSILIMRVSGGAYGPYYYPQVAGVGFSFNPYVWSRGIDPRAGVLRLVFGLGTRAVDRTDDDYTRVVALNAPDLRPESNFDEMLHHTQRRMDYMDLLTNKLSSGYFHDVVGGSDDLPVDRFVLRDVAGSAAGAGAEPYQVLSFDRLIQETPFVQDMREMLRVLEEAYHNPVDIEFTLNYQEDGRYKINLLQCRPLQVHGSEAITLPDVDVPEQDRIIEARGAVVGQSRVVGIDRFIYVVPAQYGGLNQQERYEVARLVGTVNRALKKEGAGTVLLLGPGRWGTSTPSLGVPVSFVDINAVTVLCEIVAMRKDLIPDVSLGTHFLNELVERDMLYLALFPEQGHNFIDQDLFLQHENALLRYAPRAGKWVDTVRVLNVNEILPPGRRVMLTADAMNQRVLCYRAEADGTPAPL